jgi:transcriptional regulator with XRE-family HTH domain
MPDWVANRRREIGARLRAGRLHADLTQEQLGELVGRDRRTIHRWEYAERIPYLADLLLLADALGLPIEELVKKPAAG